MALKITINKKNSGERKEDSGISGLTKVMKEFTGLFKKQSKLGLSGMLGGLGGAGLVGTAVSQVPNVAATAISATKTGMEAIGDNPLDPFNLLKFSQGEKYSGTAIEEDIDQEGKRVFRLIDNKTGDILGVINEQEAMQKGILDEAGNLKKRYTDWESIWDTMDANLKEQKIVMFNLLSALRNENTTAEQRVEISKEINAKMIEYKQGIKDWYKPKPGRKSDDTDTETLNLPDENRYEGKTTQEALKEAEAGGYFS